MDATKNKMHNTSTMKMLAWCVFILCMCTIAVIAGCSSGPTVGNASTDDYTVAEYNADIDNLDRILTRAKSLYHQIEGMGNPDSFTTQEQVNRYNGLVDQYNSAADEYRAAVRSFNSKYAANAEGDGTRATNPDNIDLPKKKDV